MKKKPSAHQPQAQAPAPGDPMPVAPGPARPHPVHHPAGARVTPRDPLGEFVGGLLTYSDPIKAALSVSPADADAAAKEQVDIRTGLKVPQLRDQQRREYGKDDSVGQETEVRTVVKVLRGSTWIHDTSKESPDDLDRIVTIKSELGCIEMGAEQVKTGTMDALLANQTYGGFLITQVKTWLGAQLAAKGLLPHARQALLADGAPLLVLLNQAQQQIAASQAFDAAKSATLSAQLSDAQSQLQLQQTLSAVSEGQSVDQNTLLRAAVTQQKQGAAEQSQVRMAAQDLLAARQGNRRDTRR